MDTDDTDWTDYTVGEKFNLWRGKIQSGVSLLWDEALRTDLSEKLPEIGVPVYFLHGVYDYTCTYSQAKAYFEKLDAPLKGFYTFDASAHSPFMEEPEKTVKIMLTYEVILNAPTFWHYLYYCLMAAYLVLFLVYFSKGVAAAQRLRRGPAILVGTAAFVMFQLIFLVFNR